MNLATYSSLLLLSSHAFVTSAFAFQTRGLAPTRTSSTYQYHQARTSSTLALFQDFNDESHESPLQLSVSDIARMTEISQRKVTMPILITETAILPDQSMEITSSDPKFRVLIDYVLNNKDHNEIGIIGLNPHDNSPLNIGVTAQITLSSVKDRILLGTSLHITGKRRFEIEDEPHMDDSGSFYMAAVEIVDNREEIMSSEQIHEAEKLSLKLPALVKKWKDLVYSGGMKHQVKHVMQSIGPMPSNIEKRALWVGSLVNPLPELKLCLEIRPAMLACKNNYQRIYLAVLSLQSSIDYLSSSRNV
jgi:hypothetical protein